MVHASHCNGDDDPSGSFNADRPTLPWSVEIGSRRSLKESTTTFSLPLKQATTDPLRLPADIEHQAVLERLEEGTDAPGGLPLTGMEHGARRVLSMPAIHDGSPR